VKLADGGTLRCHQDQLRRWDTEDTSPGSEAADDFGTFPEVEVSRQTNTPPLEGTEPPPGPSATTTSEQTESEVAG